MKTGSSAQQDTPVAASLPRMKREQATMQNEIAAALRQKITAGELKPGARIGEDWVSNEMGVSRGPVREAIRSLETEGLVIISPYRGATVSDVSLDELRNVLIPVRFILERQAVTHAITTMTEGDLAELEEIVSEMKAIAAADNPDSTLAMVDLDVKFHQTLTELGNQYHTLQLWRSIQSRIRVAFIRLAPHHRDLTEIADEHASLLAAVRTRNLEVIEAELEVHIRSSVIDLIDIAEGKRDDPND